MHFLYERMWISCSPEAQLFYPLLHADGNVSHPETTHHRLIDIVPVNRLKF